MTHQTSGPIERTSGSFPFGLNVEEMVKLSGDTGYDFRTTACPDDNLKGRFAEWLPYYRLKWAIARVLQPASILEIGVRYGYSAAAFLSACPTASYLGIDIDLDAFGGAKGAINWAKSITSGHRAAFIVADSQKMERFPGRVYDLVHVDGQQDGDGSFHDLELSLRQGRYVLVDGFFWTQQNFLAISEFLFRYRDLVEYFAVIPGYAGELIIKPSASALDISSTTSVGGSEDLRHTYTSDYYLKDCGGFSEYHDSGGKKLMDDRLAAVAAVASIVEGGRALDLGCGRGELAYHFAQEGFRVTAVDYSKEAIRIAERTFADDPELRSRVDLRPTSFSELALEGNYQLAVASDAVEHLTPEELDSLYSKVADCLTPSGIFVVHTYPNLWHFKYDYARRRRQAAAVGAFLPAEPRSRYELLMHINEQNPRLLKKQLGNYFANVLLWFGEPGNMGGSLFEPASPRRLAAYRDLWAVASHQTIDADLVRTRLRSNPLPADQLGRITISAQSCPKQMPVNKEFRAVLDITNRTPFVLNSAGPYPVHIGYHWMRSEGEMVIYDGARSRLLPLLVPSARHCFDAKVLSPSSPGQYTLRFTLVQEGVQWFDGPEIGAMADVPVHITS